MSSGVEHKKEFSKKEFKYNITISNELILASKKLSVVEKRLLYIILAELKQKNRNKPLDSYTKISSDDSFLVSAEFYAELCEIDLDKARFELKEAAKTLYDRSIFLKVEDIDIHFRWISERAIYKNGNIEIKFSSRIIPYISELEECFRSLKLGTMLSFKSFYASEFYEVLMLELKTPSLIKNKKYSISELRWYLGVGEHLKEYKNFKKVALIPACIEIENQGLLKFIKTENGNYFEEIKRGNAVKEIRIRFTFNMNIKIIE